MNRKIRLTAAAFASALVASAGMSTAAFAVPDATINPDADTQLIIHKHEGPANNSEGCAPTGQPVDPTCLEGKVALEGAEFTIYKVMDLQTNADWEAAEAYYKSGSFDTTGLTPAGVVTTGADGIATFNGDVALYYVVETQTPDGYTGAAPFFVTLPMTDANDTAWDYSVDVYPKNDLVDNPGKAVLDGNGEDNVNAVKVGDVLTYRIDAKVPNYGDLVGPVDAEGNLTGPDGKYDHRDLQYFVIGDVFHQGLTYQAVSSVTVGQNTMTEGIHYNVIVEGNWVQVVFTDAGLDLLGANVNDRVIVDYQVEVTTIPGDGLVENEAYVVPGPKPTEGSTPGEYTPGEDPEDPTNEVVSKFGQIRIHKVGAQGENSEVPLGGVTFEVRQAAYTYAEDGKTITERSCAAGDIANNPVLSTFTTNGDGAGVSDMLRLSNWYNDGVEEAEGGNNNGRLDGGQYAETYGLQQYCLVETESADGYQLLAEPVMFSLTEAGNTTEIPLAEWQKIVNQPDNIGNKLPLTGGEGVGMLSLGGLVLIGGGVGYYVMSNRKRKENN